MCLLRREDRGGIYRLRMKGNINILLGFFLMALGLSSCSFSEDSYRDLSDIADKRLGIVKGTITDEQFVADYPQAPVKAYDKAMELFMDIEAGRCDVAVLDEETAIRVMSRNTDYACLDTWKAPNLEIWYILVPKNLLDQEVWGQMENEGWWKGWENRIHRNLLNDNAWRLIVGGLYTTVVIFFFGALWAIALAVFLTYMHINHRWMWLYRPLHWFVFTIHDVPAVVLMMFFYYVVFASVYPVNGILVSIIALGIYTSGTLTKIFSIHLSQVGKEQQESARMLGLNSRQIYRYVILPQAVKGMLPLVIGEMKVLLRATSYAGYIAQKDLVKAIDAIRAQTFDAFVPLVFVSLLYLALSWIIARSVTLLSIKLFRHD